MYNKLIFIGSIVFILAFTQSEKQQKVERVKVAPGGYCEESTDNNVYTIRKTDMPTANLHICDSPYMDFIRYTVTATAKGVKKKYFFKGELFQKQPEFFTMLKDKKFDQLEISGISGYYEIREPYSKHNFVAPNIRIKLID